MPSMNILRPVIFLILQGSCLCLTQNNELWTDLLDLSTLESFAGHKSDVNRFVNGLESAKSTLYEKTGSPDDEARLLKDDEEGTDQRMDRRVTKRLTVDFMGMQVSYPQYLRLVKLQEKVVKLNKMIESLHERYSQDQLKSLSQYQRLMQLQASLMPLLPQPLRELPRVSSHKRSPVSTDFLGIKIPYPEYLRMKLFQESDTKLT